MRQFKWIEGNLQKIDARGLSAEEVEAAFDQVFTLQERRTVPSGCSLQHRRAAGSG